jgi:hypothetical protein
VKLNKKITSLEKNNFILNNKINKLEFSNNELKNNFTEADELCDIYFNNINILLNNIEKQNKIEINKKQDDCSNCPNCMLKKLTQKIEKMQEELIIKDNTIKNIIHSPAKLSKKQLKKAKLEIKKEILKKYDDISPPPYQLSIIN